MLLLSFSWTIKSLRHKALSLKLLTLLNLILYLTAHSDTFFIENYGQEPNKPTLSVHKGFWLVRTKENVFVTMSCNKVMCSAHDHRQWTALPKSTGVLGNRSSSQGHFLLLKILYYVSIWHWLLAANCLCGNEYN